MKKNSEPPDLTNDGESLPWFCVLAASSRFVVTVFVAMVLLRVCLKW